MANFTSLANYIATITARFNKPRRNLINEGILKQDIIDALSDAGKWAEDVRLESQTLNGNFLARSLNLNSTIYLNGTSGDDSRTGLTNDNNVVTGRVRTLARVAELHSGKTNRLDINMTGTNDLVSDLKIDVPIINIQLNGFLNFKKKTIIDSNGINVGEGNYRLTCEADMINMFLTYGHITVEGHSGSTGIGNQTTYKSGQGALAITRSNIFTGATARGIINLYIWSSTLNLGTNTLFACSGSGGLNNVLSPKDIYKRVAGSGGVANIDATATESTLQGDRVTLRQYHPASSTDVNVTEGETVLSPTNNKLWTKRGGTIRDAMGTTFA